MSRAEQMFVCWMTAACVTAARSKVGRREGPVGLAVCRGVPVPWVVRMGGWIGSIQLAWVHQQRIQQTEEQIDRSVEMTFLGVGLSTLFRHRFVRAEMSCMVAYHYRHGNFQ